MLFAQNLHLALPQLGHFCCDNGLCIDSDFRCDINKQYKDSTDMRECDLIQLPEYDYDREQPPNIKETVDGKDVYPKTEVEARIIIFN